MKKLKQAEINLECHHVQKKPKQDGYHYNLTNEPNTYLLWLCNQCENCLRKQILGQIIIELELNKLIKKKK